MEFYLGTHKVAWLAKTDVPLFVSHRRLAERRRLPRARTTWALDSGGFTELHLHGAWLTSEADYISAVRRYDDEVGQLAWVAPMDWMCEPFMLAKTRLTVAEHQRRTIENFIRLREHLGRLVVPVLQGWTLEDYERHLAAYGRSGVDLRDERLVGVGSVCRRQATGAIEHIMSYLSSLGLRLHGFGVKISGLDRYADCLTSADSMAWSLNARRNPPMSGCRHKHCNNCMRWAMRWRQRMLARASGAQLRLVMP